jgi:hypothetical protein
MKKQVYDGKTTTSLNYFLWLLFFSNTTIIYITDAQVIYMYSAIKPQLHVRVWFELANVLEM